VDLEMEVPAAVVWVLPVPTQATHLVASVFKTISRAQMCIILAAAVVVQLTIHFPSPEDLVVVAAAAARPLSEQTGWVAAVVAALQESMVGMEAAVS
jgi:hypothetical protein